MNMLHELQEMPGTGDDGIAIPGNREGRIL